MNHLPRFLALLLPALLAAAPLRADDADDTATTARVELSDPAKPGTLKLTVPWADVSITATDGHAVTVTTTLRQQGRPAVDDEGFRRLDEDTTFALLEKNNVVTLDVGGQPWAAAPGSSFDIKVPRNIAVIVRTQAGGDLEITGVEGDLDINSMNGEVVLRDITSSAVVNTMNGPIRATYRQAPAKPVSLTSMNGEIELQLPAATPANLRLRTHNGAIRTNFPEGILQAKTESAGRIPGDPRASREAARAAAEVGREVGRAVREAMEVAREAIRAAQAAATEADDEPAAPEPDGAAPVARPAPTPRPARVAPVAPVPPMPAYLPGGKTVSGTLNGGGVDITLTSMNGSITLRQEK